MQIVKGEGLRIDQTWSVEQKQALQTLVAGLSKVHERSSERNPRYFTSQAQNLRTSPEMPLQCEIDGIPCDVSVSFSATFTPSNGSGDKSKQYKTALRGIKKVGKGDSKAAEQAAKDYLRSQGYEFATEEEEQG